MTILSVNKLKLASNFPNTWGRIARKWLRGVKSNIEPLLEEKYMRYWGTIYHHYQYILGQTICPWADNGGFVYVKFFKTLLLCQNICLKWTRSLWYLRFAVVIAASVTAKIIYSWDAGA